MTRRTIQVTPLPSLTYCLSRHTPAGHDTAIRLARLLWPRAQA